MFPRASHSIQTLSRTAVRVLTPHHTTPPTIFTNPPSFLDCEFFDTQIALGYVDPGSVTIYPSNLRSTQSRARGSLAIFTGNLHPPRNHQLPQQCEFRRASGIGTNLTSWIYPFSRVRANANVVSCPAVLLKAPRKFRGCESGDKDINSPSQPKVSLIGAHVGVF